MRYEHILYNDVLDSQTMRETNQALQEVSKHQRESKPLVHTHGGNKDFMEKRKPIGKGA